MKDLTSAQKKLRDKIRDHRAEINAHQMVLGQLLGKCEMNGHSWVRSGDSCHCEICGESGGWWCPNSEDNRCYYPRGFFGNCKYCGEPSERK